MVEVEWGGEALRLFPERAMLWVRARTLILSDSHFGKDAAFRHAGIPVPAAVMQETLTRLALLVERTECQRIVVLGDFLHTRTGMSAQVQESWESWREEHSRVEITLVRGNHDRSAGDPPAGWNVVCESGPRDEGPFRFQHEPPASIRREKQEKSRNATAIDKTGRLSTHIMCGHVHPAVRLVDACGWPRRLSCFWFQKNVALLPAFGSFTGAHRVVPSMGDRVFVIADGEVVEAR